MTIAELKNGERFKIKKVSLAKEVGRRLVDMGFTQGVEGTVVRSALLGDPMEVTILNYDVTIRKSEARGVEVELLSSTRKGEKK